MEDLKQYEEQLHQVEQALLTAAGSEKDGLLSLKSDLQELITLTKDNLGDWSNNERLETPKESKNDLDNEYDLFKAELATLEEPRGNQSSESESQQSSNLQDELKALEGTKCRAPHGSSWGGTGYHNAMVCSVHQSDDVLSLNDIMVKVFFINPTHKEMLPCPYFLDGSCKFSEDQCHFSHGELVPFTSIKEYQEPDYSSIKMGSRVLAKEKNKLWHRSVVLRTPDNKNDEYQVKFESSGSVLNVGIDDLLPLDDAGLAMSDSSDSSDSEQEEVKDMKKEELVHKSLLTLNAHERLGNWEQHTRGIGSKLMAQMGYITGTGLGKRSDGRINPVEATVLPAGKSLDHCMTLRENAGGDKDLFSVERKMQRQKRKLEQQREREYLKEKQREKNNVFNFINTAFGSKSSKSKPSSSKANIEVKKESNKNLSIASYQIGEDISKLEKESIKLKSRLAKHSQGSVQYNMIVSKYNEAQKEIVKLKASEKKIASEQNHRKFKVKLTEF